MQDVISQASESRSSFEESRLVTNYAYLVKRAAAHLKSQVGGGLDALDVEQAGMLGLVQALRRYGEIDSGFENFAFVRIRGAMLDEIRSMDWRPRSSRDSSHKISTLRSKLYNHLQREPSDLELSEAAGMTVDSVRESLINAQAREISQLEDWMGDQGRSLTSNQSEKQVGLEKALERMTDRQRLIVSLYYFYGMNMGEIAEALEITGARVCQIHKECLSTLNRLLKD